MVRELKPGEISYYYVDGHFETTTCNDNIRITVDSKNFEHSINDEPAVTTNKLKWWMKHGKIHRLTGPAREGYNGIDVTSRGYFIEGKEFSNQQEFETERNRLQLLNEIE